MEGVLGSYAGTTVSFYPLGSAAKILANRAAAKQDPSSGTWIDLSSGGSPGRKRGVSESARATPQRPLRRRRVRRPRWSRSPTCGATGTP
jgi:hypothetical protein